MRDPKYHVAFALIVGSVFAFAVAGIYGPVLVVTVVGVSVIGFRHARREYATTEPDPTRNAIGIEPRSDATSPAMSRAVVVVTALISILAWVYVLATGVWTITEVSMPMIIGNAFAITAAAAAVTPRRFAAPSWRLQLVIAVGYVFGVTLMLACAPIVAVAGGSFLHLMFAMPLGLLAGLVMLRWHPQWVAAESSS